MPSPRYDSNEGSAPIGELRDDMTRGSRAGALRSTAMHR